MSKTDFELISRAGESLPSPARAEDPDPAGDPGGRSSV